MTAQQSWAETLNLWIARFKEAQEQVRLLQDELDKVQRSALVLSNRYSEALSRLDDEALAAHHAAVREPLPVVAAEESPGCGTACGCGPQKG